jgi:TetR/AcrR family transcriptional regulator, regulator of biofilm formation and stress response
VRDTTAEHRSRRSDPGRRDRIIDIAIDVIAERGVAGTTHRLVAAAADVPLGSMTYHFDSLDELFRLAFERHAAAAFARFDAVLTSVPAGGDPREAVVHIICDESLGYQRDLVVAIELYGLAARRAEFRVITQNWMAASRGALERYFAPEQAPAIDALIEGLVLHATLATEPFDEERVRAAVHRLASRRSG